MRWRGVLFVAMFLFANTMFGVAGVEPANAAVSCPNNNWSNKMDVTGRFFENQGVNIRTGNSVDCTSLGLGYTSHTITVHCYRPGSSPNNPWVHIKNHTTGVSGWVRLEFLTLEGYTEC